MFKKNNEPNKPKERPHIRPPEIRPRPPKPFQGTGGSRPSKPEGGVRPLRHFSTEDLGRQNFAGNQSRRPAGNEARPFGRPGNARPAQGMLAREDVAHMTVRAERRLGRQEKQHQTAENGLLPRALRRRAS